MILIFTIEHAILFVIIFLIAFAILYCIITLIYKLLDIIKKHKK